MWPFDSGMSQNPFGHTRTKLQLLSAYETECLVLSAHISVGWSAKCKCKFLVTVRIGQQSLSWSKMFMTFGWIYFRSFIVILELQLVTMFFTESLFCSSPVYPLLETSCSAPTWKTAWRALQALVKALVSLSVHFPLALKLIKSFTFNSKKFGVKPVGNVEAMFSPQSQMLGIFPAVINSKTTKRYDEPCCQEKHLNTGSRTKTFVQGLAHNDRSPRGWFHWERASVCLKYQAY